MDLLMIVIAGLIATTAMVFALELMHRTQWAHTDMVRAIGSAITGRFENSFPIGMIVHYSFGLFFAFAYSLLIGSAPVVSPGSAVIISLLAGAVHGITVGLLLMVAVAEHHPIARFRQAGPMVAIGHMIAHVVYGLFLGISLAMSWDLVAPFFKDASLERIGDILGAGAIWIPILGLPVFFTGYTISAFVRFRTSRQLEAPQAEDIQKGKAQTPRKAA